MDRVRNVSALAMLISLGLAHPALAVIAAGGANNQDQSSGAAPAPAAPAMDEAPLAPPPPPRAAAPARPAPPPVAKEMVPPLAPRADDVWIDSISETASGASIPALRNYRVVAHHAAGSSLLLVNCAARMCQAHLDGQKVPNARALAWIRTAKLGALSGEDRKKLTALERALEQ